MSATTTMQSRPAAREALTCWIHVDAALSGASGLLLAAAAPWLDSVLGAPVAFLVPVGTFLVVYAGGLLLLARMGAPPPGVLAVIVGNALWVVASVVVVIADWLTLTAAGTTLALIQAGAVALLAELQFLALRRAS